MNTHFTTPEQVRSFQSEKSIVLAHYAALSDATPDTVHAILSEATSPRWHWRGMHPWHEREGADQVADAFWRPFLDAFSRIQRRQDIFFAGLNEIDGRISCWVVSMGHLMGLFDAPFLGIAPTGRIAMLRYAEFNRVVDGKIAETAFFCDLLHLMRQAGQWPLPPETGTHLVQPGPMTHDGLIFGDALPEEGEKTLALIGRMIGDINNRERFCSPQEELARCWHDDMIWWGPAGIGATYTQDRYVRQHQEPFRRTLADRRFNGHVARVAEGAYGGFFGWANLTLTPVGGFMGLPATHTPADMRVVDIYRRSSDKLAENWVFIDLLHFLKMQGLDVLERLRETA